MVNWHVLIKSFCFHLSLKQCGVSPSDFAALITYIVFSRDLLCCRDHISGTNLLAKMFLFPSHGYLNISVTTQLFIEDIWTLAPQFVVFTYILYMILLSLTFILLVDKASFRASFWGSTPDREFRRGYHAHKKGRWNQIYIFDWNWESFFHGLFHSILFVHKKLNYFFNQKDSAAEVYFNNHVNCCCWELFVLSVAWRWLELGLRSLLAASFKETAVVNESLQQKKMETARSTFHAQLAAVMDSLLAAAVCEIAKIFESSLCEHQAELTLKAEEISALRCKLEKVERRPKIKAEWREEKEVSSGEREGNFRQQTPTTSGAWAVLPGSRTK